MGESFTTNDSTRFNHDAGLLNLPLFDRVLFILSNFAYVAASYMMRSSPQSSAAITPFLSSFCTASTGYNHIAVFVIGIISSIFHTTQCFNCRTKKQMARSVWWNSIDLNCAGTYGLYCAVCFFRKRMILFAPCILLLVGGGVAKLKGYHRMYLLLHGLWHVTVAFYMLDVVCDGAW